MDPLLDLLAKAQQEQTEATALLKATTEKQAALKETMEDMVKTFFEAHGSLNTCLASPRTSKETDKQTNKQTNTYKQRATQTWP